MKNYTYVFALILALCCCGCSETPEEPAETEPSTTENIIFCAETPSLSFDSLEAFLASEACAQMRNNGYIPYVPTYDAEVYEVLSVRLINDTYEIGFRHITENKRVLYCVTCNSIFEKAEDFAEIYRDAPEKNVILTTEKDGVVYEGYVMHTPFQEELVYNLHYIPIAGYDVYIHSDSPTPEEAIAYIHEFDLVAAE